MTAAAPSHTGEEAGGGIGTHRSKLGRIMSALLWYALPGAILVLVLAYIAAATIGQVNPPVVPVDGVSMRPTLQAGELVFLKSVDPRTLHKGDIVAVNVPASDRSKYHLPAHIVHRIVSVGHDAQGIVFTTKGDANSGPDVFVTHANDVIGELRFAVPGVGYPLLFFRSRQGEIFLGVAALLALLYFGLGVVEDRRIVGEGTAVTMQAVLEETQILREAIAGADHRHDPAADKRMEELVGAIAEYGEHLRSHTAVMQGLAATTVELRDAASELRGAVAPDAAAKTPAPTHRLHEQRRRLDERRGRVDELLAELDRALGHAD